MTERPCGPAGMGRGQPHAFDVLVVGAGPAGSAAARRLAQGGCRVLLVERSRFSSPRVGESLAPAVQPLLRELGVWERFAGLRRWDSWGTWSVWGSDTPEAHSHILSPNGCGWHVDRLAFDRMLAEEAAAAGADLRLGAVVVDCAQQANGEWRVQLARAGRGKPETPDETPAGPVTVRLLIDATGRSASLARSLGAQRTLFDNLVGVATQWAGDVAGPARHAMQNPQTQHYILLETVPDGWWYSAPLPCPPPRVAMAGMLFTDADVCARLSLSDARHWQRRLDHAPLTRARLEDAGKGLRWGPHALSAVSQRLRREGPQRPWLAAGDAALSVDPISGSGVARALKTGQAAAGTALEWLEAGSDPRRSEVLDAYEAARDRECTEYLVERRAYYAVEGRWADAEFWQRRCGASAMA